MTMADVSTTEARRQRALQQAAEWIVRAEEDDFTSADAHALRAWLDAGPEHAEAYRELKALWGEIPGVPHLADQWPIADNDDDATPAPRRWPRIFAAGLAVAAAAVLAVWLVPFGTGPVGQRIGTGVAQISKVTLADGSIATLGPKTELTVAFSGDERRLRLEHGEAFFDVAKDRERPFIVDTGRTAVKAVGTRFNVKGGGEQMQVAVLEGIVQVLDRNPLARRAPLETLHRGDVAQVTQRGGRPRVEVSHTADIMRFGAITAGWRDGWLSYEDATLAQIVDDLNRYYAPGIRLADPSVGALHVTASFKAENIGQFLDSISGFFPVLVEKQGDGGYVLRPAAQGGVKKSPTP